MGSKHSKNDTQKKEVKSSAVVVCPNGGLGNQLFQIANGYAYSLRYKKRFFVTDSWKGISKSRPAYWNSLLQSIKPYLIKQVQCRKTKKYVEPCFSYKEIPFFDINFVLHGYYQSEDYFYDFKDDIRKLFAFPDSIKKDYIEKNGICVAIHIRRGDYKKSPDFHTLVSKSYYNKAKKIIEEKLGTIPNYYYFSDDTDWVKENFKDNMKESDKVISGFKDYEELYIMSQCDHFIIANSSFSWWSAWLSCTQPENSKIVICPDPWFGFKGPKDFYDIYCKNWIHLKFEELLENSNSSNVNWKENCEIYYINLEHRTDRKEQIENELLKVFPKCERFNAIKHSNGAIGCGKSQIEVLKKGLVSDKEYICIFEDDVVWELKPEDVKEKLDLIFSKDFNLTLLAYHYPEINPKKLLSNNLGFFENCQMAASYIIHKKFIPILLANFENCVHLMETKGLKNMAIDQSWKSLQTFENKFFVSSPRLAKQKPSYSDIEKKFVSYGGTCFMGILSCEKYKSRRDNQNLKLCPFEYRYFIGNPELSEAVENKEEKIVYLPCNDGYEFLTQKVHEMIKWININYPHIDYIFKTDDDIKFNFINLLKNFKTVTLHGFNFAGFLIQHKECYSNYLKQKDPKFDIVKVPATKYCAGGGYFISKKCIDIIIPEMLKNSTPYEDQSVGYCLNKHNIFPENIKLRKYSCYF